MKVGLMGGTFDPIHNGHLMAAQSALESEGLQEVWFMPTNVPPHKPRTQGASAEQRWEMVCLAVEGQPGFKPVDVELRKGGVSYSIDTVTQLRSEYPEHQFYYIIGADMVGYLPKWYKIEELARLVTFIGLERPGYRVNPSELPDAIRNAVVAAVMPQMDISSTEIRNRRQQGKSIRYWVPDRVQQYIEVNRLYEA
jgi:nicotinate-nucleotide adenylyltransferase